MNTQIPWPQKTRELQSNHFDSTVWNEFSFRDDDIVIGTYAKSGTTYLPVLQYFRRWLEEDGYPWWSFWENIRTWWEIRELPNVMLVHFGNLRTDLAGEMRAIARFLDIPVDESRWEASVNHCTFDYMKTHAESVAPLGGSVWEGGATTFINKGTNGRWRDTLTDDDIAAYERTAVEQLGHACAHWLATGETQK